MGQTAADVPTWHVALTEKADSPNATAGELGWEELDALFLTAKPGPKDGLAVILARTVGRRDAQVTAITMFGADFDTDAQERPNPPFFHWWYETHSSTPEARRWRLIFPLAADYPIFRPEDWRKRAWPALAKHLGLADHPGLDKSCRNPSRIFYLPRAPEGQARLTGFVDGPLLDWEGIVAPATERPPPAEAPTPAPSSGKPVDLALLRGRLAAVHRDPHHAALCKHLLGGERLAPEGARHEAWKVLIGIISVQAVQEYGPDVAPEALWQLLQASFEAHQQDKQPFEREEVDDILTHALSTAPTKVAEEAANREATLAIVEKLRPKGDAPADTPSEPAPEVDIGVHLTDTWLAEQVVEQHGQDLKRIGIWNKWLAWDGKRWAADTTNELQRRVRETVREIHKVAAAGESKELAAFCIKALSANKRAAAALLAGYEKPVAFTHTELDQKPWLLNAHNGTADLQTGTFRPHAREDFLTKLARVNYDAAAECPLWEAFLARIMGGDGELISFLQRAIGYSLTGSVREQVLFFLYGSGANGKSTLALVLLWLLGDYGRSAAPGLLLAKKGEAHPTAEADLFGARFVVSQEIDQNRLLAEGTVKQLTGGDRMSVRRMREDFWEFDPTHKIWLCANHKPVVQGTDYAIWRRILLIPFTVTIPIEERDQKLLEKLRGELPGILNWALKGCLEWQRTGLNPPKRVLAATAEYRSEMDTLGEFLAEKCTNEPLLDKPAQVSAAALYTAYETWARFAGYSNPLTRIGLGRQLSERPELAGTKSNGARGWKGVRLLTQEELGARDKQRKEAEQAEESERLKQRAAEAAERGITVVQGSQK